MTTNWRQPATWVIGVAWPPAGSGACQSSRPVWTSKARSFSSVAAAIKTRPLAVTIGPPRFGRADRLHNLLCRFLTRPGFLSHLRSFNGYDGPEILPSSTHPICLISADAGHSSFETIQLFTMEEAMTAMTKAGQIQKSYRPPAS
jgi:hypothetical protein